MKRKIKIPCVILCFMMLLSGITINAEYQKTDLEDSYLQIYEEYKKKNANSRINNELNDLTESDITALEEQKVNNIFYDFFKHFKYNGFSDLQNDEKSKIILNENLNTPIYYASVNNDEKILIQIGYRKYYIHFEISDMNKKIVLTTDDISMDLYSIKYEDNLYVEQENLNPITKGAGAYWLSEAGGIKGKTGGWLTVLSIVVSAGGWVATLTGNVVGGYISQVVSSALTIGSLVYTTYYTITYQSRRSDCTSYIRERKNFYQYSNHSGYLKQTYSYFHSVRPDYAGGACMGY
ncbi:MAG: hypothetical protein ACRDCN_10825 [Tannerellaceae bacterium]